jgi:hypothetical protein
MSRAGAQQAGEDPPETAMIRSRTEGHQLLAAAARWFSELTRQEFEVALQDERQTARRH